MVENIDWPKWYEDAYLHAQKSLDESASKSLLDKDFFKASAYAKRAAKNDDFYPRPGPGGEPLFTTQQGLRASCHTREEVAAILVIQKAVLRKLTALVVLGLACFIVLLYIAFNLHS